MVVEVRAQPCPTLCSPVDCNPPGSSVHGVFQAGILEWVAMSSSRGSSQPRDQTWVSWVSCIAGRFFTTEPPGKPTLCPSSPQTVAEHNGAAGAWPLLPTVGFFRHRTWLPRVSQSETLPAQFFFFHFPFTNLRRISWSEDLAKSCFPSLYLSWTVLPIPTPHTV